MNQSQYRLDQILMHSKPKKERDAGERKLLEALASTYPEAHCELRYSNPLELLVATILSAQCTDKRVNEVTVNLFGKYQSALDYARAPLAEIEAAIHSVGFFRSKAKNLQACCKALVEKHEGQVPKEMSALTTLAGVGRKTANVVLGNAFGLNEGVVVDTHVARLAWRLGWSDHSTPEKIEQDLMKKVPRADWAILSHRLIWHGRRRCFARNPDCEGCELKENCPKRLK